MAEAVAASWFRKAAGIMLRRTAATRSRSKRLRQKAVPKAPPPWPGGRALLVKPSTKIRTQRIRRDARAAKTRLLAIMREFCRIRVIAKVDLPSASDGRRMLRLTQKLVELRASTPEVVMALLFDRAWRDPARTNRLIRNWGRVPLKNVGVDAMWQCIITERRRMSPTTLNSKYWSGPSAFHNAAMVHEWRKQDVVALAFDVAAASRKLNAKVLLPQMMALPRMARYNAYAMFRVLEMALGATSCNSHVYAASMSKGVAALSSVLTLADVIRAHPGRKHGIKRSMTNGDAALLMCETGKALVRLGLLTTNFAEQPREHVLRMLAGKPACFLEKCLRQVPALGVQTLQKAQRPRSQEWLDVDKHMPMTEAWWDTGNHFCRGSESLVSEIRPQLVKLGWMQPLSSLRAADRSLTSD